MRGVLARYFFGSLINQCECSPGFEGDYCEIPTGQSANTTAVTLPAPKHVDRYRYDIKVQVSFSEAQNKSEMNRTLDDLRQSLSTSLISSGLSSLTKLRIHDFIFDVLVSHLHFSFYIVVTEDVQVPGAIKALIGTVDVAGIEFAHTDTKIERNHELYISEFVNTDNSNKHMTLRGKMLTLVCAAKGSNGIRFEWYKDDARLDTSLTLRNAWETVIQDQVHNLHLANLNLDVVFPIDQGVFTCKAIDFDEVQTKTLKVTVNNYPQVQLDPMSISVQHGEALTIYCMSPDDSWLLFKYEWYKNGIKIDTNARLEYTEDMYPTGLLLAVTKATKTAEYTCKVTNEAGAASATAYLFVVPKDADLSSFCTEETEGLVTWSNTSAGHFDVKRCPTEFGGNAKRDCKCDSVTRICKWEKPNFSKCQSLMLIYLHDEVLLLKNGYQKNNITKIFDDLYNFALTKRNVTFYSGDIDMVAGILEELISHMLSFPQLNSGDNKIEALRVAEVIGAILHRASTATPDEKRDIMAGPSTIATINILISGAINLMMYDNLQHISYNDLIESKVDTVMLVRFGIDDNDITHQEVRYDDVTEQVYSVTTNFLADLLLYRDEAMRNESRMKFDPVSRMYSMAPVYKEPRKKYISTVRVIIKHNPQVKITDLNTTKCIRWSFDPQDTYSGMWTSDGCVTIETSKEFTTCECELPGHFVVGLLPSNITGKAPDRPEGQRHAVLSVCYVFSVLVLVITLIIFIASYGLRTRGICLLHLSYITSTLLMSCVCLLSIMDVVTSQAMVQLVGFIITFCLFVAMTTISLEMFHIFLVTHRINKIEMTTAKFAFGAIGIPLLTTLPVVVVGKAMDTSIIGFKAIFWLNIDMKRFYVFLILTLIELAVFVVLVSVCLKKILSWRDEAKFQERKNYLKAIAKGSVLIGLQLLFEATAVGLESSNADNVVTNAIHAISVFMFSIAVLVVTCALDKNIRHSCCIKFRRGSNVKVQEGGSQSKAFRTYMKPELVSRVVNPEEYNVSRYYDEVNRTKYTAQRKRELSALLGSSDTNSITMDTRSTSISGSDGSKESTAPSLKIDFSFSVRRDSVFETINDSNGERRSIGASGSVKDDVVSARGCFRLRNDSAAHSGAGKNENNGDESNDLHGCVNGHAAMCNNDDLANLSQIPFSDRNMVQNPLYKRINTDKLVSEELKHLTQNPGQLQYDDIYPLSNNRVSNLPLKRAIPDIPDKNCNLSSTRSPTKAFNPLMNYISERGNVEHSSVVPTKANDTDDDMLFNNKTDQDDDYESPRSSN
ncbi:hypothetical protein DPMN_083296 [Dreissena polymorpha]|uniref:Uncharacterized protein n=1 Tax=Dreissena polymorpha TaxID=45954 RepID=A0A9D3Y8L0_DREPO|nr:hypothetical protein DPMN_083296 [Dreissena polymorpha]